MDNSNTQASLRSTYELLSQKPRADGKGKITVFCAAHSHTGTSFVTRNIAMIAAQSAPPQKQILIIDMDIQNNAQSAYFYAHETQAALGVPEGPFDASFKQAPFWKITPSVVDENGHNMTDAHYMYLYSLRLSKITFTHFHWEKLRQGQNVHIQNARLYWNSLRDHYHAIFVDTPALDRADILGTISPEADQTVLVSPSHLSQSQELANAYQKIKSMGAQCAGVILNDGATQPRIHEEPA